MKRFWGIVLLVTLVFSGSTPWHIANAEEENFPQNYNGELAVAKAIDMLIRSSRAKYTQNVVGKLQKDGTGSSVNHSKKKGFIPLPAQFVRSLAADVLQRQKKEGKEFFNFFLRSRWNLNLEQGLKDDFEKRGWEYILRQQKEALQAGVSLKKIRWKPYVRVEIVNGRKLLRYFSADPASAISCITCHNAWEQKPQIKKLRKKQGIEAGKIFQMYELMGALAINVSLNEK